MLQCPPTHVVAVAFAYFGGWCSGLGNVANCDHERSQCAIDYRAEVGVGTRSRINGPVGGVGQVHPRTQGPL